MVLANGLAVDTSQIQRRHFGHLEGFPDEVAKSPRIPLDVVEAVLYSLGDLHADILDTFRGAVDAAIIIQLTGRGGSRRDRAGSGAPWQEGD